MKIIIYTITDCEFSKQEREYLTSHTLQYEEKNLETNKEFLTEMLAISNNFAGTPVTKIEKDDGAIVVLKGFTKEEFDKELGFSVETPVTPPVATPPVSSPAPQPMVNPTPVQAPTPVETSVPVNPLNSVLDTLSQKAEPPVPIPQAPLPPPPAPTPTTPQPATPSSTPPAAPLTPEETPLSNPPNIPDFKV